MMEEGAANELENRIRLLIAPMNFWEQVGFLSFLHGVATHDGITTQEAETRRTAFRSALTFGLPAGIRPNVEDVDIDFIVTAALSDKEEFRQIIQRLQSAVIHESDIRRRSPGKCAKRTRWFSGNSPQYWPAESTGTPS